jgi:acyl carrier protein
MNELIANLETTLEKDTGSVRESDVFRSYPEWDSLMVFAVLSMLSDEYDISITRAEFDEITTVKELYNYIQKKQ